MPKRCIHPDLELLDARQLAAMLNCRREHVYALARAGRLPAHVHLGDSPKRWRTREILDWLDAGLPDPDVWDWRPTVRMTLEELIRRLSREAQALSDEIEAKKHELEAIPT